MRIRDGDSSDPGWKKVKSGIRDKHPGSATLRKIYLELYMLSSEPILAVTQLNELTHAVPHRTVIVHHARLHRLHAGLAIKNPPKKNPQKKPTKNVFFLFFF